MKKVAKEVTRRMEEGLYKVGSAGNRLGSAEERETVSAVRHRQRLNVNVNALA